MIASSLHPPPSLPPSAVSVPPASRLPHHTQVDVMHEEYSSVTHHSSIVLTQSAVAKSIEERAKTERNYLRLLRQLRLSPDDLKCSRTRRGPV